MKSLFFLLITTAAFSINGQIYSGYYRANVDVELNQKVDVSGNVNVNKTITSIDYGALANANAQRERNRIEKQRLEIEQAKYRNELEKQNAILYSKQALEIAENPIKAHDYGQYFSFERNWAEDGNKAMRYTGFYNYKLALTVPHNSLFQVNGPGRIENVSNEGITTEIITNEPLYNYLKYPVVSRIEANKINERRKVLFEWYLNNSKPNRKDFKKNPEGYKTAITRYREVCDSIDFITGVWIDLKEDSKMTELKENEKFLGKDEDSVLLHKKEFVKRTVCGHPGFRSTMIWEDDFEKCITDNYSATWDGIKVSYTVRYKADKNSDITFEDIEGRRFYLLEFMDKHIRTRSLTNPIFSEIDNTRPLIRNFKNTDDYNEAYKAYMNKF